MQAHVCIIKLRQTRWIGSFCRNKPSLTVILAVVKINPYMYMYITYELITPEETFLAQK